MDQSASKTPVSMIKSRLASADVDALGAELACAGGLRCSLEDRLPPRNLDVLEPRCLDRRPKLCFQQSAGDSTRPEIDVLLCLFRDGALDEDISDLEPTRGDQHAVHLGQHAWLVGCQV